MRIQKSCRSLVSCATVLSCLLARVPHESSITERAVLYGGYLRNGGGATNACVVAGEWDNARGGYRAAPHVAFSPARRPEPDRREARLRDGQLRRLHRAARWRGGL